MKYHDAYTLFANYGAAERLYRPETLRQLVDVFRNWITPRFGALNVEEITLVSVLELRSGLLAKKVSAYRQYAVLMWVKAFLKFCRSHLSLICLDPAEVKLPKRGQPNVVFLTNEEVQHLVAAIPVNRTSGKRLRALIELLLASGMRIGEALALNRIQFDGFPLDLSIHGKGGKRRTVFLNERSLSWIHAYLRERQDNHEALFVTTSERSPQRLARADISKMFITLRKSAGISKAVTPHVLRHTYCTNLLNNGTDIRFIRDLAGHADIQTTARYYLGTDDRKLRELVDQKLNYGFDRAA